MTIGKVAEVVSQTAKNGNTFYKVIAGGKSYVCFDDQIKSFEGKEVEFEVKSREGFATPTLVLPKSGWSQTCSPNGAKSQLDSDATRKTMVASFTKDLIVAFIAAGKIETTEVAQTEYRDWYDFILALVEETPDATDDIPV